MASYNPSSSCPAIFGAHPVPMADPAAPAGTFVSGTKIQVGSQKVVIQKYFSEGGFAHVYLVKMPKHIDGTDIAVLKRVAVPDKEHLANMRTEVETMKKLKGHRPIVTYYDSHASQLKGGGYEVFLLMEFCNGGGLIDFMNTRLQNRLTEPEILKIFSDVAEGVACMHYLKPPLLHRDLKVENVLITSTGHAKRFKLCDFGSTAPPRPAATTASECRLIEDDVMKHTTLQYRSPEMIDVYRKQPIDEKSDIWALGVLLYKLCYYTTPFEAQGQLAILNASFKFPAYPVFSDKLKKLIASMLKENPKSRPNIYQVLREACLMQGIEVPIKDIYAGRTASESRRNQQLPTPDAHVSTPPVLGAVFAAPAPTQAVIPDVVPMRRGRPQANSQGRAAKPSPSPMRGTASDPFAALDSKSPPVVVDEISNRFPSLDQFSLLHDGGKFDFDKASPTKPTAPKDLGQRVTDKLADDAFASLQAKNQAKLSVTVVSRAQKIISSNPELQAVAAPTSVYQPTPTRPTTNNSYVSQGTMTTPTPPSGTPPVKYRFPPSDHHRSASLPRNQEPPQPVPTQTLTIPRNSSFTSRPGHQRQASLSSRPSLEGGRPNADALEPISRTKSSNSRPRPASTYLESNMDFLREKESTSRSIKSPKSPRIPYTTPKPETAILDPPSSDDEPLNVENSSIDFLREAEAAQKAKEKEDKAARRRSSGSSKAKRTSLPSMSLSGTKTLLAGKFGDAFKRFENNVPQGGGPRTPSPLNDMERERRDLTPVAGSEATGDGDRSEDEADLPPEQRRELERRRLSMEEKRVANAAAEYRKRLADRDGGVAPRSIGGVSRAASIQNKVKSLLDENRGPGSSPAKKTAEGYGRFTHQPPPPASSSPNPYLPSGVAAAKPAVLRKPVSASIPQSRTFPPTATPTSSSLPSSIQNEIGYSKPHPPLPGSPATVSKTGGPRPEAKPKPMHLNNISTGPQGSLSSSPSKSQLGGGGRSAGRGLEGIGDGMSVQQKEDYIVDFSKRFPSLSGIEMVETRIEGGAVRGVGERELVREVGRNGLRGKDI